MNFKNKKITIFALFGCVLLAACSPTHNFVAQQNTAQYRIQKADTLSADSAIERLILPYRQKMSAQMDEVIAVAAQELTHTTPQGLLGNWAAEAIAVETEKILGEKLDFCTLNHSGLRVRSLPKGNITRGKIYELMPFDNAIAILTGDSAALQPYFQHIAAKGGWPLYGASFEIKDGKATNIRIRGEILRGGKNYRFVVPDYIANGGDNCDFLKKLPRKDLNKLMRDAFLDYCKSQTAQGKMLDATLDDRTK